MTDIVERLRRKGVQLEKSDDVDLMYLVIEAADEIERLRRELEDDCLYKKECERLKGALELEKQASRDVAATYTEQEAEIERLRGYRDAMASVQNRLEVVESENAKLRECVRFFRSVIQSGEEWTGACEQAFLAALQKDAK